ncbi:glycosyltransferase family 87 protein [Granulicella arctica]|uniref:DUF2029 domain-containing protein n=1 Tax=Granulicella arctica TaxID=940613 RepID=A0A7Y9PE77_9BACT|nr:glycosyltransferase family 87 protein [Granulicella arctica]NYF78292.1 hypothetical protein [Granulicella arctica]
MNKTRWLVILVWSAVLFSTGEFIFRGIVRHDSGALNDFAAPYVATRMWLHGDNPYDSAEFFKVWGRAGGPNEADAPADTSGISGSHAVYPPPSLPLMTPMAVFSWKTANRLLIGLTVVLYLAAVWMMLTWMEGGWNGLKKPLFLAYALGLAPIHSVLHTSNIAGLSGSLLLIGTFALLNKGKSLYKSKRLWGPVSVAAAVCIKVTMGAVLVPYLLRMREWRTLRIVVCLVALVGIVSLAPIIHDRAAWISDYKSNVAVVFTHGGAADVSGENHARFDLLNLQLPFYALLHSRELSSLAVGVVVILLLGGWVFAPDDRGGSLRERHLLLIAGLAVIGLLAFYQRYYSGVLLLVPMLWAMQHPGRASNRWTIAICCCFLGNTEAFLRQCSWFARLSQQHPALVDTVIGPHLCWLLLILAVILVSQLYVKDSGRPIEKMGA